MKSDIPLVRDMTTTDTPETIHEIGKEIVTETIIVTEIVEGGRVDEDLEGEEEEEEEEGDTVTEA